MFRRSPRALLLWVGAAGIALVTALVVGNDLATLHRRARDLGPEVAVAVAVRDLPLGATVTGGDVSTRYLHESQLPEGAVTAEVAEGRIVAVPVVRDAVVSRRNLAPRERDGLDGVAPPGMRIVRVVADAPDAGRRVGAAVDVLATFDTVVAVDPVSGEPSDPTVVVARGATVIAIDDRADGPGDVTGTVGPGRGMTLLVTDDESRAIAYATAAGVITVALVPPEDARAAPAT
ncbi:MAG TPA: SAF domain-containing protein [Acidimicrobiia bacterium]